MSTPRLPASPAALYGAALLVWIAITLLYPPWSGRFYNPQQEGSTFFSPGGTFSLTKSAFWEDHHPLWAPPRPHSSEIEALLRWPWRPVTARSHVELALDGLVLQISLGIVAIGIAFLAWNRGGAPVLRPPETVFHQMVWSVTVFNSVAIIIAFVLVLVSSGYAPGLWYIYILSFGCFAGLLHGLVSTLRL